MHISKIAIIGLTLFAVGCSSKEVRDESITAEDTKVIRNVDLEVNRIIRYNNTLLLPPLDLSEYRKVRFNVVDREGVYYVVLSYEDYERILELIKTLEGRIDEQHEQIDEILNFYDKQLGR